MPLTPQVQVRQLTKDDIPFAQKVRKLSGWNQTDADWNRLLTYEPEGCFLIEFEGQPAGTATTTSYSKDVGWIGMVLVHPDFRRKGLATRLLQECIDYLKPLTRCIKLDATPDGKPVYEKLGFEDETQLNRWQRGVSLPENTGAKVTEHALLLPEDIDAKAFGTNRCSYLNLLAKDSQAVEVMADSAYGMLRHGNRAWYLGPIVCEDKIIGEAIVRSLLSPLNDELVYWDIPQSNKAAVHLAGELGFSVQRTLIRMRLGDPGFEGVLESQWAIGAPETG